VIAHGLQTMAYSPILRNKDGKYASKLQYNPK
jgi:hypothetical protein